MTVALIALSALCFLLLGVLVYVIRHNDRENETREAAWRLERTGLLNRIQVPEAAPFMDVESEGPQYVGFDDDEGFQALQEEIAN